MKSIILKEDVIQKQKYVEYVARTKKNQNDIRSQIWLKMFKETKLEPLNVRNHVPGVTIEAKHLTNILDAWKCLIIYHKIEIINGKFKIVDSF